MASAIQTVPSAYIASQIVRQAAVTQPSNQASSLLILPSTMVSLGTTTIAQVTYNASGVVDTGSSSGSTPVNQSVSTQASVATTDSAQNAASIKLAADLAASTIAENLAVLDNALADSLANQLLINTRAIAAAFAARTAADASLAGIAERLETSRQIEIAKQAIASNSARTQEELLAARVNQSIVKNRQDTVVEANSATTLALLAPQPLSITNESGAVTNSSPTKTANVVAASNPTSSSLSTSEVANSPVGNPQQIAANANLVGENHASVAASSTPSPSVIATPITPEEATAAFAISSITDLTQQLATTTKNNAVKTDSAATLPIITPQPLTIANESSALTISTPAATANVVAASNPTTSNLSSTPEVASSQVGNPTIDAVAQAVTTVTQDPTYPHLVAGTYVNMAAASAQSPTVTTTPTRLDEIKPVISIPAITAITQIGAQSGRDGNPAFGYRQRAAISNARVRPALTGI